MNPTEQAQEAIDQINNRPEYIDIGPKSRKVEIDRLRDDMAAAKLNATADEQFAADMMKIEG